jgi:antitoxin component HigA of HigAB toxin-antitoxin module
MFGIGDDSLVTLDSESMQASVVRRRSALPGEFVEKLPGGLDISAEALETTTP